jgi:hypothetical protein
MNEYFEAAYSFLSASEKDELAMYIGMVELERPIDDISFRPIVHVMYKFYVANTNPNFDVFG